jgi:type III secretion system YscD/HrpQ family protein
MPAHLIAKEGPLAGLVLNFEEGDDWIIGRDPDVADLVVEDSTVSRKHARIVKTPQGFFLQNLSRVNPALVNGEKQETRVLLHEGDLIQIGNHHFVFSEKDAAETDVPPSKKTKKPPKNKKNVQQTDRGDYDDIFGELEEPLPPAREESEEEKTYVPAEETTHDQEITAYDTIFEDLEDLEEQGEVPFHLLQPAQLLLKVISGPNAGAEIGIEKGKSYVIGKDSNSCDIVFQDLSVSRNHARISVTPEGTIELEDLGSKNGTSVNGTLISEKTTVTSQDIISLGTTVFLIIDREAPQETIYSPMVPSYESSRESDSSQPGTENSRQAEEEATERAERETDWKQTPIPTKHIILAASFLAIFLIIFVSFFSLFKSHHLEIVHKEPVGQISDALAKFTDVQFSYNPGSGRLFLTGHVLSSVEYQELMYRIGEISFIQNIDNTVVIDELVWKMANDILNDTPAWRTVSIHSPKAGSFVASGYVATSGDAALLNEYLTVNFPYLDRLENDVAIEEVLNLEIQNTLRSGGFGGVTFQLTGGDLVLSGGYGKNRQAQYDDTLKALNQLRGIARVRNLATVNDTDSAAIDITQNYKFSGSVTTEGHGYNVVLNDKVYVIGDTVDGMVIKSIKEKTIFLEKDGLNYRIGYNGL